MAYATPEDLVNLGLAPVAFDSTTHEAKLSALQAASDLADGYLSVAGCMVPIPDGEFTDALRRAVAIIAAYDLLSARGYGPEKAGGDNLRKRFEDVLAWLQLVADQEIDPPCMPDEPPGGGGGPGGSGSSKADVISSSQRGWSIRGTGSGRGPFVGD